MKIRILLFFVLSPLLGLSQNLVNIPVAGNSSQVRAVNLKENGIIVLDKNSDNMLNIQKIDTSLNQVWETQTDIPAKANFIDEFFDGQFLYIILEPRNAKSYTILKISSAFSAFQKFEFTVPANFQYGFFAANDRIISLGGVVKSEPLIALMETSFGTPKYITGSAKGTLELQSINLTDETILATFINTHKKTNQIIFREYDYSGKVLSNKNIPSDNNVTFLSAKYFDSHHKSLVVGNYGIGKTPSNGFHSSQGIFVTDVEKANTRYYSFDQFKNLFGFMSDRQKDRLEKQVKKKKDKGSEYSFDYRLFISGLQFSGNQTRIIGEVFQPEFRSRNYSGMYGLSPFYSNMYWGRPMLYNYYWLNSPFYGYNYRNSQVFDGFRYLEGVIISIDEDGNLLWDNSFPYKNQKYYDLATHLKVSSLGANTMAMYSSGSKLNVAKLNQTGSVLDKEEFDPESLDLQFRNKKAEFSNFEHWYDNVYFNWGVQKSGGSNQCFIQKLTP